MILPQDCTVTGIETVYEQLRESDLAQELTLDAKAVMHLDLSFMQCLKALELQNVKVQLVNPSDATEKFCRLYQATHFLAGAA